MNYTDMVAVVAYSWLLASFAKIMGYKLAEVQHNWAGKSWMRRTADCVQIGGGVAFVAASSILLSKSREWAVEVLGGSPVAVPGYVNAAFVMMGLLGFIVTALFFAAIYQDRIEQDRIHKALVRERKALRKVLAEDWEPYVKVVDAVRSDWVAAHAGAWKRAKLEIAQFNFAAAGANPEKTFPPGFLEPVPDLLGGPAMPDTEYLEAAAANGPVIDPKYFN